jgi:DNA-binding TFAR19-related protein (PDSD5 family)
MQHNEQQPIQSQAESQHQQKKNIEKTKQIIFEGDLTEQTKQRFHSHFLPHLTFPVEGERQQGGDCG